MRLLASDLTLDLVRGLRTTLGQLRRHDAPLATQLQRALASIALNVAEATGRRGRDRAHLVSIALGSLREVNAALEVAEAFGWIAELPMAAERNRLGGLLYGLRRA